MDFFLGAFAKLVVPSTPIIFANRMNNEWHPRTRSVMQAVVVGRELV
jgi:hypothetical protein